MFLDGDGGGIDEETVDQTVEATVSLTVTLAWAGAALVVAYLLVTVVSALIRRLARRRPLLRDMATRLRKPLRALLMTVAVWVAVTVSADRDQAWYGVVQHTLVITAILAGAWLVGAMAFVVEDRTLARLAGSHDDRHKRRVETQISIVRRFTVAVVVVFAIAAVLLTFPQMRTAGASILASAGVLSLVAGLAAQSSLANTFAGMQIAFTDAIRVDDVVVLEGEFGRIEEITLTYVVVHVWDDRRIILPSTYFTTTPFENWTRRAADLLGTVEFDVDFRVPLAAMRAELERILRASSLWDERLGILEVTSATSGYVRVRALVSAQDSPTLWDLRCTVREGLVSWLQREAPYAIPRTRFEEADHVLPAVEDNAAPSENTTQPEPDDTAALSPGAEQDEDDGLIVVPGRTATSGPRRTSVRERGLLRRLRDRRWEEPAPTPGAAADATMVLDSVDRPGLYSGSESAEERSRTFNGPGQDVIEEREENAERRLTGEIAIDDDSSGTPDDPRVAADGTSEDGAAAESDDPADDEAHRRMRRSGLSRDSGEGGPVEGGDGG
ncbi:mechanosensitive ion channel [Isoptericola sp. b515]|uniref:mechanosensitive ion channel family protein n=1 Tax=Isoptericola sp. b515 TaxID=3064652 RepID=UPI0027140AD9|nr:mechanosensitive ion channel domain-containing protein [Isoptericola sp. b515]MDO8147280.1 mechanosensitive ion channel [Isoptericola sp. b515]